VAEKRTGGRTGWFVDAHRRDGAGPGLDASALVILHLFPADERSTTKTRTHTSRYNSNAQADTPNHSLSDRAEITNPAVAAALPCACVFGLDARNGTKVKTRRPPFYRTT